MEDNKKTIQAGELEIKMEESPIVEELKRRIWSSSTPMNVIQLRNSVTDMFMLKFLTLGEYTAINADIERFIQYSISYGIR